MTLYQYTVLYNPISNWVNSFSYFIGNTVFNNENYYRCILDHLSDVTNDPGTGGDWRTYWEEITVVSPNTDITRFVETLKDTEIGSGEVRSLHLRLNANLGAFITETNGGLTPILDQFDKVLITIVDPAGMPYTAVYEVDIVHPTKDGKVGTVLPVDLLGTESHLQRTLFADQFFFDSMFETSKGITDLYNKNKGKLQPTIIGHNASFANGGFNNLPRWTSTDYTFNLNEKHHYNGLIEVIDRGGSSVAAGGAGDFFELGFFTNPANYDQLLFRGFSSGNPPDQESIPNIIDTASINPAEQEGEIRSFQGNVVGTWCGDAVGTLPRQNADFIGALEAWRLFPQHVTGELYPQDAIIRVINTTDSQGDNFHYKANKDTTISPPTPPTSSNADWDQYFFTDFVTNEIGHLPANYSFWTDAKSSQWKSNGARTNGNVREDTPTNNSLQIWDSNQVVVDGVFSRTWADVRAVNFATIPLRYIRNGSVYRGFRVLVDGTGVDEFEGFDNRIIQWSGSEWLIFKEPAEGNLVAVDNEGDTYQFRGNPLSWQNVSTSMAQVNDCYHPVYDIYNTQGHNSKSNGGGGNYGQTSAVTHEFRYLKGDISAAVFDQRRFYRMFAGVNFRVPFPFNSDNGNSIGIDYGDSDELLPATFEAQNMGLTASGLSGFNNIEAEDLGPFDALTFFIKHNWRYNVEGTGGLVFAGNFAYRCVLYDIDDAVVKQDFVIPFNNLWAPISLPMDRFVPYEARVPWSFGEAAQNIFLQEIEVLRKFRWRNIKKIAIHWLGPYDKEGRYQPWGQIEFMFPSLIDTLLGLVTDGYNVKLSIDSFQWAKPGLSVSPPNEDRAIQPIFFYEPLITNKFQNDQANMAKLEITKFRHKQYEVTGVGFNNLSYGDSFFLENEKLVSDADRTVNDLDDWQINTQYNLKDDARIDNVGYRCIAPHMSSSENQPPNAEFWDVLPNPIPHTIKLVAKKIERLIDKVPDGPGGFLRTITGVRRFRDGEE